ncbi:LruC domain-containing protein [Prevotella sp. MA2016]|uniref:LruC domain-containing protein n=1 Tax=Prevotella sp. MA2016 TaxID=1408310 RepID=UPI00048E3BF2|nr:LruC domain-containing protein [Prevotella sp. MA2016]
MRKSLIVKMIAGALTLIVAASCDKNVYDEKRHGDLIHYYSSVDSVDQQHMWMLSQTKVLRYQVPAAGNYKQLQVYSANPLVDRNAELMNSIYVSAGQVGSLSLNVPYQVSMLYVALVDGAENLTVASVPSSQAMVDFSEVATGRAVSSIKPQTYTYLFEENYPEPGDYDYNDVVLRISQQRTAKNQITVGVTIAAVGAVKQIAGCIRLVGYRFQDIDTVSTTTGMSFNDGINKQILYFHKETDLLIEGNNHEAVLNLFCDAHWAMAFNPSADYGLFQRKKYNVTTESGDNAQLRSTRTINYVITFKDDVTLDNFTHETLDPFILTDYNAGTWETHTEQFKSAQVLHKYFVPSFKDLPWALMVPDANFKYPLEGTEIGYRKKTDTGVVAMFGAYTTIGHSFGEWAEDHNNYLDWYLYPNTALTF